MIALFVFSGIFTTAEAVFNLTTTGSMQYTPLPTSTVFNVREQHWITFLHRGTGYAYIGLLTYYDHKVQPEYVEVFFGGLANTRAAIRFHWDIKQAGPSGEQQLYGSEFRPFWVSWERGIISAGTGTAVGQNVKVKKPFPFPINHVSVASKQSPKAEWIIDDTVPVVTKKLRFEQTVPKGLFMPATAGLTNSTIVWTTMECLDACVDLIWCRGFSYNVVLEDCRMFDYVPADGNMSDIAPWETWSLIPL